MDILGLFTRCKRRPCRSSQPPRGSGLQYPVERRLGEPQSTSLRCGIRKKTLATCDNQTEGFQLITRHYISYATPWLERIFWRTTHIIYETYCELFYLKSQFTNLMSVHARRVSTHIHSGQWNEVTLAFKLQLGHWKSFREPLVVRDP
jgi:hypothetical protein